MKKILTLIVQNSISSIDGIKIVDNLKYYLCIRVKAGAFENLEENKSIKVKIGDSLATGIVKKIQKRFRI